MHKLILVFTNLSVLLFFTGCDNRAIIEDGNPQKGDTSVSKKGFDSTIVVAANHMIVELHAIPRNVSYDPYSRGVYQFDLVKHTIKNSYDKRTYETREKKDTLIEYFYSLSEMNRSFYDSLIGALKPVKEEPIFIQYGILMIFKLNSPVIIDTIYIDRIPEIVYKNKKYVMPKDFWNKLRTKLPTEIRSNWDDNLSGRL